MKKFQYVVAYVVHKLYSKFKFSKNKDSVYSKPCLSILLYRKIDSDGTKTLINAKDRGGLWRANETVQNIFIECEKIFRSFTSEFRLVVKYTELRWYKKCKQTQLLFQIMTHCATALSQK